MREGGPSGPPFLHGFADRRYELVRIVRTAAGDDAIRKRLCHDMADSACRSRRPDNIMPDNKAAERALRPIGIGRRNWLFADAETGAETLARAANLIEPAKKNGLDPEAYLSDILSLINDYEINRLDEVLL